MSEPGTPRLASVSVDLDEVSCYESIHGLAGGRATPHAVYDRALPRWLDFLDERGVQGTFFVVGADLERAENRARAREAVARGHELASHSHTHLYDLTRRSAEHMSEEVDRAGAIIAEVTGARPAGFRSPGYVTNEALLAILEERGYLYDSSVFPCPAYYAAKAAAMLGIRLRGRRSRSVLDHPRVLTAPADPYRVGARYHLEGEGLLELPVAVTKRLRLPFIGTFVVLGGSRLARALARGAAARPVVSFEAHGIDLADAEADGLAALAPHQPDLRVSLEDKRARLSDALDVLVESGHRFVRMDEVARSLSSAP